MTAKKFPVATAVRLPNVLGCAPPMTDFSHDTDTMDANAFKAEGALLFNAQRDADSLKRRLADGEHITIPRDELALMVERLERAVQIAREYHLGAAELTP